MQNVFSAKISFQNKVTFHLDNSDESLAKKLQTFFFLILYVAPYRQSFNFDECIVQNIIYFGWNDFTGHFPEQPFPENKYPELLLPNFSPERQFIPE